MRHVGEYLHSEFREPSIEAGAMFKRLAAEGKEIEQENKNPAKTTKLNCMSCGVQNEYKQVNDDSKETCKGCGKLIFKELKNG